MILAGVKPGRIVEIDGRYGVVCSRGETRRNVVTVDFWQEGRELVPANSKVRVLPQARTLCR